MADVVEENGPWWRERRTAFVVAAVVVAFVAGLLVGVAARGTDDADVALRAAQGDDIESPVDVDDVTDAVDLDPPVEPEPVDPGPVPPNEPEPAPPAPPPGPGDTAMREVLRDPQGKWSLWRSTGSSCLELRVNTVRHGNLLCAAARPSDPVGEGHTVATDIGRLFVGLTDGTPNGALVMPPKTAGLGLDKEEPGLGYAVLGVADGPTDAILTASDAPVAHITVPAVNGPVSRARLQPRTGTPYERLAGFARVASTGLWYGGHEIVGFYDHPDGRRCARWGRYGGSDERILADSCAAGHGTKPIVYAAVVRDSDSRSGHRVIAVAKSPATRLECSSGACSSPMGDSSHTDPGGSGLVVAAGPFASALQLSADDVITIVARDASGSEVDRRDVKAEA